MLGNLTDWDDNILIAKGEQSAQVEHALEIVAETMKAYPGADISFTGHSLGAGLASLMAVFFDRPAYVFAPAPFAFSAMNKSIDIDLPFGPLPASLPPAEIEDSTLVQQYFSFYQQYAQAKGFPIDAAFRTYSQTFDSGVMAGRQLYDTREARVGGTYIQGEVLEDLRRLLLAIGQEALIPIDIGDTSLSEGFGNSSILHNILLHAALVNSDELAEASRNLPRLLEVMTDTSLYAQDKGSRTPGFLNRLLTESIAASGSTSKIDQFAEELLRLGSQGSTHLDSLQDGLIAAAMEYFYERPNVDTPAFFQAVNNGVRFDISSLAAIGTNKGLEKLQTSLAPLLSSSLDISNAGASASSAQVWTVQSGASGLVTFGVAENEVQVGALNSSNDLSGAAGNDLLIGGANADLLDGGDDNDSVIGGGGADLLNGGEGVDYLSGGTGIDTLTGGSGDDFLAGGDGADVYVFKSGDGIDNIIGNDNDGQIVFDEVVLTGAGARPSSGHPGVLVEEIGGQSFYYQRVLGELRIAKSLEALTASEGVDRLAVTAFQRGDLGIAFPLSMTSDSITLDAIGGVHLMAALPEAASTVSFLRITTDNLAPNLQLVTGAETYSFSNGFVDVPLTEGRTALQLALLVAGDVAGGSYAVTLTAQIVSATGQASEHASLNLTINGTDQQFIGSTARQLQLNGQGQDVWTVMTTTEGGASASPYFVGTSANELIFGSNVQGTGIESGDYIDGGAGDDFIAGGHGADTLLGGDGNDYIRGSQSATYSQGNNAALGLPTLVAGNGWGLLDTGDGNYLPLHWAYNGYVPSFIASDAGNYIDGGAGEDDIEAGGGEDVVHGGADDDRIRGGGQGDTLLGEDGDDTIYGDGFFSTETEIEIKSRSRRASRMVPNSSMAVRSFQETLVCRQMSPIAAPGPFQVRRHCRRLWAHADRGWERAATKCTCHR